MTVADSIAVDGTPVVHAEVIESWEAITDDLRRLKHWTMEATVGLPCADGVIMAVSEPEVECVRALIIRRGQLGVLGHSWRGGQALWAERIPTDWWHGKVSTHLAATLSEVGDLVLYVNGRPLKAFTNRGMFPGRCDRQRLTAPAPVSFINEQLGPWRGPIRDLAVYDQALTTPEVERRARVALGEPELAPEPALTPRAPDPVGCSNPTHLPAWRPDGDRLRCLTCDPPRGCDSDDHERYWRPIGGDMRSRSDDWWRLTCSYCTTAAARAAR